MTEPLIISVVLNFNKREDTLDCLSSLIRNTYRNNQIIVLDNQSTDGSVEAIRAEFPAVEIIVLEENLGYAGNNNVGIKQALHMGAEWVFILNEDTILDPDCLSNLTAVGESEDRIGIVGPMVYHYDEPDVIQTAGGKLSRDWNSVHLAKDEPDQGQYTQPHQVDWISGCGIMVRRAVIEQVGVIDERYFYYWEETEWCLRAGRGGWKIWHIPAAKMWHKGAQRNVIAPPSATYYATRNRLLTLAKHKATLSAWVVVFGQLLQILTSWTVKPKWRSMQDHRDAMWHGMRDFLFRRWGKMPS